MRVKHIVTEECESEGRISSFSEKIRLFRKRPFYGFHFQARYFMRFGVKNCFKGRFFASERVFTPSDIASLFGFSTFAVRKSFVGGKDRVAVVDKI